MHNRDIFSISMKLCYVFSLESPHGGDSNEYSQYTIFQYISKRKSPKIILNLHGLEHEFETSVVNEPSGF